MTPSEAVLSAIVTFSRRREQAENMPKRKRSCLGLNSMRRVDAWGNWLPQACAAELNEPVRAVPNPKEEGPAGA